MPPVKPGKISPRALAHASTSAVFPVMLFVSLPTYGTLYFTFWNCLILKVKSEIQRAAPTHKNKKHDRKKQPEAI